MEERKRGPFLFNTMYFLKVMCAQLRWVSTYLLVIVNRLGAYFLLRQPVDIACCGSR